MAGDANPFAARESALLSPAADAGVIGRELELDALGSLLQNRADSPRPVVLDGEPGIGKTTLWHESVEAARKLSHRVPTCRPAETEASLPYCALGDLLEPVVDEGLPQLLKPRRLALEVALLRSEPPAERIDRLALWRAVLTFLRALTSGAPVLIAIDDVQWVDDSTAQALAFALRKAWRPATTCAGLAPQHGGGPVDVTLTVDPGSYGFNCVNRGDNGVPNGVGAGHGSCTMRLTFAPH